MNVSILLSQETSSCFEATLTNGLENLRVNETWKHFEGKLYQILLKVLVEKKKHSSPLISFNNLYFSSLTFV